MSQYERVMELAAKYAAQAERDRMHSRFTAAISLHWLIREHLHVQIAIGDLEKFIRDRWDEIAPLAHKIHSGIA